MSFQLHRITAPAKRCPPHAPCPAHERTSRRWSHAARRFRRLTRGHAFPQASYSDTELLEGRGPETGDRLKVRGFLGRKSIPTAPAICSPRLDSMLGSNKRQGDDVAGGAHENT